MTKRSIQIGINPKVWVWLRESSGWTISEVAKRLQTTEDVIIAIEQGKKNPSMRQLKLLAVAFHRPLATFLLPEPKKEKPLPKDYRTIQNQRGIFHRQTLYAIRKARNLQTISQNLALQSNIQLAADIKTVTIEESPTKLGAYYRSKFQLSNEKQQTFKTSYQFFKFLRQTLEKINILVFQFSMPIKDARGFTLVDENPLVIVVNQKDSIEARLFTLMHEFAHVLLGETIIDNPSFEITKKNKIEYWCNEFAASFLLPLGFTFELLEGFDTGFDEAMHLRILTRKTKLSKSMIYYNLYKHKFVTKEQYEAFKLRLSVIITTKPKVESSEGGIPQDKKRLAELGSKFISLVADNYEAKVITYSDALDYLSIRSKNFDKLLTKAEK